MKFRYEYDVIDKETGKVVSWGNTRLEARIEKDIHEQLTSRKCQIIQRQYALIKEAQVR